MFPASTLLFPPFIKSQSPSSRRKRSFRASLQVEELEPRVAPAETHIWSGAAGTDDWYDRNNWLDKATPQNGDSVIIDGDMKGVVNTATIFLHAVGDPINPSGHVTLAMLAMIHWHGTLSLEGDTIYVTNHLYFDGGTIDGAVGESGTSGLVVNTPLGSTNVSVPLIFDWLSGTISRTSVTLGAAAATASVHLQWSSGTFSDCSVASFALIDVYKTPGAFVIPGLGAVGSMPSIMNTDFTNRGTFNINDGAALAITCNQKDQHAFQNLGRVYLKGNVSIAPLLTFTRLGIPILRDAAAFGNAGIFERTAGTNQAVIMVDLFNAPSGQVINSSRGSLDFYGDGKEQGSFMAKLAGSFDPASGTRELPGVIAFHRRRGADIYEVTKTARFNGDGEYQIASGHVNVDPGAKISVKNLVLNNGNIDSGTSTDGKTGPAMLTVNTLDWRGGLIENINITVTGRMDIASSTSPAGALANAADGLNVTNLGAINWMSGEISLKNSVITNDGSRGQGSFNVQTDAKLRGNGSSKMILKNGGSRLPVGEKFENFDQMPVENDGGADKTSGMVLDGGGYTQTAGSELLSASTVLAAVGFIEEGGSVVGSGTIQGEVVQAGGEIDPGGIGSAGTVSINGYLTQEVQAILNIDIGGYTAGTTFDQVNVSNVATLDGTLNLNLINGFSPNIGDTFQVANFGSYVGAFQTVTGAVFAGGARRFVLQYNATNLTLTVVSNSSGSAPTVINLGTTTGTTAGGTSVNITGTSFQDANGKSLVTSVAFGVPLPEFPVTLAA
jgi:hypothetical protein